MVLPRLARPALRRAPQTSGPLAAALQRRGRALDRRPDLADLALRVTVLSAQIPNRLLVSRDLCRPELLLDPSQLQICKLDQLRRTVPLPNLLYASPRQCAAQDVASVSRCRSS
jgi:hypothetical protein